jgi:hypothetical protein
MIGGSMADQAEKNGQALNLDLRRAVNNAYAFVKGREAVQSFAAFTFEDALDQQIQRIEGTSTATRLNDLERIDKVESDIVQAIMKIKSLPPESFSDSDPETDVNTPVESEEDES